MAACSHYFPKAQSIELSKNQQILTFYRLGPDNSGWKNNYSLITTGYCISHNANWMNHLTYFFLNSEEDIQQFLQAVTNSDENGFWQLNWEKCLFKRCVSYYIRQQCHNMNFNTFETAAQHAVSWQSRADIYLPQEITAKCVTCRPSGSLEGLWMSCSKEGVKKNMLIYTSCYTISHDTF